MIENFLRQKKRYNVALPIHMHLPCNGESSDEPDSGHDRGPAERAVTCNISSAGCYFLLSHELPLGSLIDLEIILPALQPIPRGSKVRCRAKVVRVDYASEPGWIGIACSIEEYRIARTRSARTFARAA
jgi:hypothetical protein